jgi:hypothetical protein
LLVVVGVEAVVVVLEVFAVAVVGRTVLLLLIGRVVILLRVEAAAVVEVTVLERDAVVVAALTAELTAVDARLDVALAVAELTRLEIKLVLESTRYQFSAGSPRQSPTVTLV